MPVLFSALLTTTMCGLLFGSAPAWQASRIDLNETLKQSHRTSIGSGRRRLRQSLVVVELALAVTSLAGAGLAIYSFWNRTQVDLGIDTARTLTFSVPVTQEQLNTPERIEAFYRQLLERLRAVPGVTHASVSTGLPLQRGPFGMPFHLAGSPACESTSCPSVGVRIVSTEYFETLGASIVRGRAFTDTDTANSLPVVLVSQLFVDQYLRGLDPLRQRIELSLPDSRAPNAGPAAQQIVGVFRTINNSEQLGDVSGPELVLPFWQHPLLDASVAVRTAGDAAAIRAAAAAAVKTIDPNLPLVDVRTMTEIVGERLTSDRLNVALYGGLAAVALLLAVLGVYGVMAFSVARRTPEIGMRMALGAGQQHVRRLILREGAMLSAGGLALGVARAYMLGRAMQSTLFGTGALNVPVLLVVSAVLVGSALLACYLPARRASAVDPMIALRQE
jgi:putative ABC transport system permease protein